MNIFENWNDKVELLSCRMKLILLSGFSGAGKDTVASILVLHKAYTRFAFADPIKQMIAENLQVPLDLLHSVEGKQTLVAGKTLRQHCIDLGERKRKEDVEYWVKETADAIRQSGAEQIVISDWRHLPELLGLQKQFPTAMILPIRITRVGQTISPVPDVTEYGLMGFPFAFTLQNDGFTQETLLNQINSLPL